ncbi:hypothetical protein [Riemerella anatipestifer]|uniref:hypothetical protein n=1 Tax=Riemerella anatipestifer TaxID=34085 RepID=UPI00129DCE5E|nr:hypothetical protein [Riemerella anatipestifer]MRM83904.1 hypothetical protein [Riemerella anatipestifer]
MKNLLLVFFIFLSINIFSQKSEEYKQFIQQLKNDTKTDKNDKSVLKLLNDFYEQALQSEKGELNPDILDRIQKIYADKNSKNLQILNMFLMYQDHITKTAAVGKQPDSKFQVDLMDDLEAEIKSVYGECPVIIDIYKAEALNSNGQAKESAEIISKSLEKFPNSVPLKVYKYLDTKDEKIKQDLIRNHSRHWMVQQFEIK